MIFLETPKLMERRKIAMLKNLLTKLDRELNEPNDFDIAIEAFMEAIHAR